MTSHCFVSLTRGYPQVTSRIPQDPVVFGVVVPSEEAIVRAEVDGVPFEILAAGHTMAR